MLDEYVPCDMWSLIFDGTRKKMNREAKGHDRQEMLFSFGPKLEKLKNVSNSSEHELDQQKS